MAKHKLESDAFDVVPLRFAIKAMRDSGYRNAAYAIAELVDNAVQAKAKCIEVLCKEEEELVSQRNRRRVREIAVVDDGTGMTKNVLRKALQFGVGERLDDRSGIGRFGMGLPNSSISQARRVDVWSWTSGAKNALYTYLDLDEIESGEIREVPEPIEKAVPKEWHRISATINKSRSGTIVVWSNLDKCDWRTAHAIFKNSEYTIGRIYRRFLQNEAIRIRMAAFLRGANEPHYDEDARPNDPMYLMTETSCPAPWNKTPMFEALGNPHEIFVKRGAKKLKVSVRFSVAKKEARGPQAGSEPHGKHAANNIGVSVMRADRELELQTGWCIGYDPRERWWGVEVDFPPDLDEVFGVPNNKQGAPALAEFAVLDLGHIARREGFETEQELIEAWTEVDDLRVVLVRIKQHIESNLAVIRRSIKAQAERSRASAGGRHDPNSAEVRGTKATEARKSEGHLGSSDADETLSREEKEKRIASTLEKQGLDADEAVTKAKSVVYDGRKYEFYETDLQSAEFFTVKPKAGAILIGLNTSHPAYDHLVALLKHDDKTDNVEELRNQLRQSYEGLKLLLEAWARYEDELTDGRKKEQAQNARADWGRVARDFFRDE